MPHDWLHRQPSANEIEDKQLMRLIQTAFDKGRNTYGTRRIKQALAQQGMTVSRRRIGRLMNELGLVSKVKRTTKRP